MVFLMEMKQAALGKKGRKGKSQVLYLLIILLESRLQGHLRHWLLFCRGLT